MKRSELRQLVREVIAEIEKEDEAWEGNPEIKSTGQYAGKTIAQLKSMKKKLMDKEKRTKPEQKKVKQIQFAIGAKRDWKGDRS